MTAGHAPTSISWAPRTITTVSSAPIAPTDPRQEPTDLEIRLDAALSRVRRRFLGRTMTEHDMDEVEAIVFAELGIRTDEGDRVESAP